MAKLSPMMQQYMSIKEQNKDYILLFRLGDFYEMFFDDALLVSQELDLTLTGRDCGAEERAPMCGVPFHSVEGYIARLIAKGYKVAMCDQLEEPSAGKIVERGVVRVITPGTVTSDAMLDAGKNNFLAACCMTERKVAVAFADISTGELMATVLSGDNPDDLALGEISKFPPSELLYLESAVPCKKTMAFAAEKLGSTLSPMEGFFSELSGKAVAHYGKDYFPQRNMFDQELLVCVGMILSYLEETQRSDVVTLGDVSLYSEKEYMEIDAITRRNLELTETMRSKEKKGSLLWVLDKTCTGGGARLLRKWILQPLCNISQIKRRQGAVQELHDDLRRSEDLTQILKKTTDLYRLSTKITMKTANGRDLLSIGNTLRRVPELQDLLRDSRSHLLGALCKEMNPSETLSALIADAILADAPFTVREGGLIRDSYHPEVARLRGLLTDSKSLMADIETREREKTGIKNLKIGYNRVFGYYLEITKSNYDQIPSDYIRKQTLANCERFVTQEIKELENEVLSAGDKLSALEHQLFSEIVEQASAHTRALQELADQLAQLDVLISLAAVARANRYSCPHMVLSEQMEIKEGRHPVVENMLEGTLFVPNDTVLDNGESRLHIITGPNMAGKSTYMRQVALLVLMAQMGSFVPALSAKIGLCDKIFTRVGASDDLASGQSTFMVEMSETAMILKNATASSLLIFDEIGRGTSTFDGMSIARSVVEYVLDANKIGAKTLFATHYHELCQLEGELQGVKNYNIAVKKRGDDITFLRKIVRGGADQSYGIEVAKLAGVPDRVITRAKEILKTIEDGRSVEGPRRLRVREDAPEEQMGFLQSAHSDVLEELKQLDISTLTPLEALNKLDGFARKLRS